MSRLPPETGLGPSVFRHAAASGKGKQECPTWSKAGAAFRSVEKVPRRNLRSSREVCYFKTISFLQTKERAFEMLGN